jgi:hypothetical protein
MEKLLLTDPISVNIVEELKAVLGEEKYSNILLQFYKKINIMNLSIDWEYINTSWVGIIKFENRGIGFLSIWEINRGRKLYVLIPMRQSNNKNKINNIDDFEDILRPNINFLHISLDNNDFNFVLAALETKMEVIYKVC